MRTWPAAGAVVFITVVGYGADVQAQPDRPSWSTVLPQPGRLAAARSSASLSPVGPAGLASLEVPATATQGRGALPSYDRYDDLIASEAAAHGVRADLVRAIIQVESNFNPRAVSSKGARGLMQLMPATARSLRVTDPFDPAQNIRGGVRYLRGLLDRYEHDESLALAAYNAGPTAVARYGNRVPPFRETRNYIQRVRAATSPITETSRSSVIYKLDTGAGSPRYTNVRPTSAAYVIVGRR